MFPQWRRIEADEKENPLKRELWFCYNEKSPLGLFYRDDKDDNWILIDCRGESNLMIPLKSDKTIVEVKDFLIRWLEQR